MKQIKTIRHPLKAAATFDEEVNAALLEGWQLTKREVLGPMPTSDPLINTYVMLYAELEREKELVPEGDRRCCNCKHLRDVSSTAPCRGCMNYDMWEPADG